MLAEYGIRCVAHDVLLPRLRPRLLTLPGRDGSYDFGAARYEDRLVRLACDSVAALDRAKLRELAGLLSRKGRLELGAEPDKAYVGRIYDEAQLTQVGRVGHAFELAFVCEPFAEGETVRAAIGGPVAYRGTAETGVRMWLRNVGTADVQGIRVLVRVAR